MAMTTSEHPQILTSETAVKTEPSPETEPRWLKVLRSPVSRFFLFLLCIAGAMILTQMAFRASLGDLVNQSPFRVLRAILTLGAGVAAYLLLVRFVERRPAKELSFNGAAAETGFGILVGAGVMSATVGMMALFGAYRIAGFNDVSADDYKILVSAFLVGFVPAVSEELLFRGVLFRIVEEKLGSWIALAVSSLFFGLAHISNPNATLFSSFAIAVEAGILLGAAYMLTRRLWAVMGLHFAWNTTQGGVFGVEVSGTDTTGWIEPELTGSEWLTGGAFGAEASLIAVLLCTATGIAFLLVAIQRGNFVYPFWNKARTEILTENSLNKKT